MIKTYIKGIFNTLSEKEKEIANFILNNSEEILNYTISEFAKKAKTSDSTVYRFIRKIGFLGYHDFKLSLVKELSSEVPDSVSNDLPEELVSVINKNIHLIDETLSIIDYKKLMETVDKISIADRLFFVGVGSSAFICDYASKKFNVLGKTAIYYSDLHTFNSLIPIINEDDLVIFISHTGVTKDVVSLAKAVHDYNVTTISISSGIESDLAKNTDILLSTSFAKDDSKIEFLSSRISEFMVIEILINSYYNKIERNSPKELEKILSKINAKRFL